MAKCEICGKGVTFGSNFWYQGISLTQTLKQNMEAKRR